MRASSTVGFGVRISVEKGNEKTTARVIIQAEFFELLFAFDSIKPLGSSPSKTFITTPTKAASEMAIVKKRICICPDA